MLLPITNASHYNVDIAHFCDSNKMKNCLQFAKSQTINQHPYYKNGVTA